MTRGAVHMDKSPDAFRTISEVADTLDLPQHVLRFWETRFSHIRPLKRGGGRRYYRPDDVDLLKGIRHLLYGEGYTIKGVQRILKEEGPRFVQSVGRGEQQVAAPAGAESAEAAGEVLDVRITGSSQTSLFEGIEPRPAGLSATDAKRLREALDDLAECERVLNTLKTPDPSSAG
jgi:DNA-binding transcriptional MerR regulator